MLLFTAVSALGALAFLLASALVVADRKLRVEEDPRIDAVEELLPHANCGACGYPGCRPFAEALVAGAALPAKCTVSDDAGRARIAAFLGVDVGVQEKVVARLACAGGSNVARLRARYVGPMSCAAATLVGGGGRGCDWGCLGFADCADSCDFDAIHMNAHSLPVVDEDLCTACGDCVEACPKDLFSLQAASHRLWVACRSLEQGDGVLADCQVACTACGRCAKDAPSVVAMRGNLPVVDVSKPIPEALARQAIARCPTGAIVWLEPTGAVIKGPAARLPIRQGVAPTAPT